ncbi:MAG: CpsD/CapB family tyrosine-protein kinase [Firmicutes bacterium]|nr:CpsD/CapB family tyrosine-protein kinase [Bacillota bacterium]
MNKKDKKKNLRALTPEEVQKTIGSGLSFGAAEAYKLLRTNLDFSLPDESGCKVIGVTSPLPGEGKTTTSVNISYTIAQSGKQVLLIEGDLRLPAIHKYLPVHTKPGLSNLLAGKCSGNEVLQRSGLLKNLWVMNAGDIPPNPAELLGSTQMAQTMQAMKSCFDVIIVDLPPVTVVSDAIIISKLTQGMVVVVRQDYCDRTAVNETVRKLKFADAKILGFVMTGSDIQKKRYSNHYYKKID